MRVHWNTSGRVSQALKVGYGIWKMVHTLSNRIEVGTPVGAQASQLDLNVHVQSFPTQEGGADDCEII